MSKRKNNSKAKQVSSIIYGVSIDTSSMLEKYFASVKSGNDIVESNNNELASGNIYVSVKRL